MQMFAAMLLACNPVAEVVPPAPLPTTPATALVFDHLPASLAITTEAIAEATSTALTGRAEIVTQSEGSLALLGPLLEAENLGLFDGVLGPAARLSDGTLLVERDGELWTYDGDWRSTPLDGTIDGLDRWLDLPDALWVEDAEGLRRFDGSFFGLTLDGEPIRTPWAVGGRIYGTPAVWTNHNGRVVGLTEREGGWTPLVLRDVEAWDLGVDREGWLVVAGADGLVHLRDPATEQWSRHRLPHTVHRVFAHPGGDGVWLRTATTWYVWLNEDFHEVGTFGSSGVAIDALGRLVQTTDGITERRSVTRPVQIMGIEPGAILATEREIALAPTAPDRVVSVTVTVFGADHAVSERPWVVVLDPIVQPDDSYSLEVDVTYDDGQHGVGSVQFWVGDPVIPTWGENVLPIHQQNCAQCHDGDVDTILDTPEAWATLSDTILEQVQTQAMPLGGPPLSDSEIATIRSWRNAGFPQ